MVSRKFAFAIVFIVSALALQLQFIQTRILSFALWSHFCYGVITMALLGFAASGTFLSVSRFLRETDDKKFYFFSLFGFSLTSYFASRYAYFPVANIFSLSFDVKVISSLIISYTISMVPYFFAGLVISATLMRFPKITGPLYFFNLIGSGFGCLFFILAISPLGAIRLLILSSYVCCLLLLPLSDTSSRRRSLLLCWMFLLLVGLVLPENTGFLQVFPEKHKQFWDFRENRKIEYSKWNPISRIDILSDKTHPEQKYILTNGDAQAMLFSLKEIKRNLDNENRHRQIPYALLNRKPQKVLVLGSGGGFDVGTALLNGASTVDAVEINPTIAYLASEKYAWYINYMFSAPGVHLSVEDARSFVRRSKNHYDIIKMYLTDSLFSISNETLSLFDNYLYTENAIRDYLDRLSEDGALCILRWFYIEKPRDALRIFATALHACRNNGYENPSSHLFVIMPSSRIATVIIKKRPFSAEEKERLLKFCYYNKIGIVFPKDAFNIFPATQYDYRPFIELADLFDKGKEDEFYEKYPFNVRPVDDDSPFIYQYGTKRQAFLEKKFTNDVFDRIRGVWSTAILSYLLLHSLILSVIFVVLPLFLRGKQSGKLPLNMFTFFYFSLIGLAFMFVEVSVMQKFVLFLGHPVYSMATIIPAVLFFAGLGSLASHRIKDHLRAMKVITLLNSFLIIALSQVMPKVSDIFLMQVMPVRVAAVILTIAPLAFFMGFPFPLAMRLLVCDHAGDTIPWAWAINGSFSVIASILAVIIAIHSGFRSVLYTAAICYAGAFLASLLFNRSRPGPRKT